MQCFKGCLRAGIAAFVLMSLALLSAKAMAAAPEHQARKKSVKTEGKGKAASGRGGKTGQGARSKAAPAGPDVQLAGIFGAIVANRLDEAMVLTDRLLAEQPNFRLAHLIRGDLLLARVRPVRTIGNVPNGPADDLQDLREEAVTRLHGYYKKPGANLVPRYLLQLRPDQKTAVVVDTRRSRLYVYENVQGRPRFLADYYISQGKLGSSKSREGDQKTPIGVYHITGSLPRARVPDFYGAGAMPINYPNEWDQMNGRTGHGIWLHGTPSNTYSRAPKASDGCVVLSNRDLQALFRSVQVGVTPVIISENVEWLSLDDWDAERRSLLRTMETWRLDWESRDNQRYLRHYSPSFVSNDLTRTQWANHKAAVGANKNWVKVSMDNLSMLRYPGKEDMVVVTFEQNYRSNNMNNVIKKRQYWKLENKQWKILFEGKA